jgi:UDP-N-acetylglucosamine 2-epimerase
VRAERCPELLQAFIGTKAQYIKTAPVLRELDARGIAYRLIDSGQHAALSAGLRDELGVHVPDQVLGSSRDVVSIPGAAAWATSVATRLAQRPERIRDELFAGAGGICIVHGDTPTTFLATALARRAGLRVAHLEAGLRSRSWLHPFPEELIRLAVMRWSDLLFAPDGVAVANLAAMKVRGRVVPLSANTTIDALRASLGGSDASEGDGPALITMHRVENLHRTHVVDGFVDLALLAARQGPVRFVVHGPTQHVIDAHGRRARLTAAGVELVELAAHADFVRWLAAARFVVTDGGSIQEECALLGVPTLLWRARTERPDGIGENVVLSRYDRAIADAFVTDPSRWRRPSRLRDGALSPSAEIVDVLLAELARGGDRSRGR